MVWSYMHDYENSDSPYEDNKKAIALWKTIADETCHSSDEILALGKKIMKLGIKEKDSLHIACAVESGCDYFITTDKKVLNKTAPNIKIVSPIAFIIETEGREWEPIMLRLEAIGVLLAKLGEVDTERFISMIKRDTFDYTEWQRGLWKGKGIDEMHSAAVEYEGANG